MDKSNKIVEVYFYGGDTIRYSCSGYQLKSGMLIIKDCTYTDIGLNLKDIKSFGFIKSGEVSPMQ